MKIRTVLPRMARLAALATCLCWPVAQASAPWLPVDPGPAAHADLRGAIISAANGYQIYFKNFGSTTVHFGFYLGGKQSTDSVSANRRLHLKPGNVIGPLAVVPEADAKGDLKLHAVAVVEGEADGAAS